VIIAAKIARCIGGRKHIKKQSPPCHGSPDHVSRQYSMQSVWSVKKAAMRAKMPVYASHIIEFIPFILSSLGLF